jgi:nitrogen fixation protein NifB
MKANVCAQRSVTDHPCFYGTAKARWGRVHLPVAPECNVQCNFCNRLYDCANESRPAVTQGILEPGNVLKYLGLLLKRRSDISVVGIAGPGDPLCEPERTLETVRAVHSKYPNLLICISTNGLNLTEYIDDLAVTGVTHMTVTVNAVDPSIGQRIYSRVTMKNNTYRGIKAAEFLLSRQREAIAGLKARGLIVKINTVVIPGINVDHIAAIAEETAHLGVDIMNCIPMIPVPDTPFEHLGTPTGTVMDHIRSLSSLHIPQMYHCQRCRADAIGLLCSNESSEHALEPKSCFI